MKTVKIKINEPWLPATLNRGKPLKGRIVERIEDSYLFEFDFEVKYSEVISSRYLIGKIEDGSPIDIEEDTIRDVEISLAIYSKENLTLSKRPSFRDMRGRFLSGTIST